MELRPLHLRLRRADLQTRIGIRTSGRRQDSADQKEEAGTGKNGCLTLKTFRINKQKRNVNWKKVLKMDNLKCLCLPFIQSVVNNLISLKCRSSNFC